jgi:hypothetical protein
MNWESWAWVAVALASAPVARLLESPLQSRWPSGAPFLRRLAPWAYGIGPAYLALISGAVLARAYGFYGRDGAAGWALSILLCAALLLVVYRLRGSMSGLALGQDLVPSLLDEPRWALYRAVGVQWLGTWGLLVGLAIGTIEWATRRQPWRSGGRGEPETWVSLARLCISTILFVVTGNVWLTWATQATGWLILSRSAGEGASEA